MNFVCVQYILGVLCMVTPLSVQPSVAGHKWHFLMQSVISEGMWQIENESGRDQALGFQRM